MHSSVLIRPIADVRAVSHPIFMEERNMPSARVDLEVLKCAVEASWDHLTSYQGVLEFGNPALGQCYSTSRVVQWFYPDYVLTHLQMSSEASCR